MKNFYEGTITEVRKHSNCVKTVAHDIRLKQISQTTWIGRCPKCGKITLAVDAKKYICLNDRCDMGGDAYTWLMRVRCLNIESATYALIADNGLPYKPGGKPESTEYLSRLMDVCEKTCQQFEKNLPTDQKAVAYLRRRGLSTKAVKKFRIGFDDTTDIDADTDDLIAAGIYSEGRYGKRSRSRFRWRVTFPIFDTDGHVVAFGGRRTDDSREDEAKYINSPGTALFDKSRTLYGMNFAKDSKRNGIVLCEGYMDVIAMHAAGFDNAVAALGTALTDGNIAELKKHTEYLCLMFDSDEAGQKATEKAIHALEGSGMSVFVAHLSGAKDPDEFIKKYGAEAMHKVLGSCVNADMYLIRKVIGNSVPGSPEADHAVSELLNSLPFSQFQRCIQIYTQMKQAK